MHIDQLQPAGRTALSLKSAAGTLEQLIARAQRGVVPLREVKAKAKKMQKELNRLLEKELA